MERHECVQIMIFVGIVFILIHLLNTQRSLIEHLTPGPPTLLTLQTDTKDLDTRLTDLKTDFEKMKSQASAQAGNAAAARAQLSATKYS
jgi:hypothetical protein